MKILVMSDSHAGLSFMRYCLERIKPDHVVHLGDHYGDAEVLSQENPNVVFHCVPGNCDRYRCAPWMVDILCYSVGGVRFYMTHGHKHGVKSGYERILLTAREADAQVVLFGHTHSATCYCEDDGLWVMNPGSCGSYSGSVGLIEIIDKKIVSCRILRQEDVQMIP